MTVLEAGCSRDEDGLLRRTALVRLGLLAGWLAWVVPAVNVLAQPLPDAAAAPVATDQQNIEPLMEASPIPTKNLLQVIHDGGPLMLPIGVCSFLLLVFVFERAISFRRGRVIPGPFVRRFLEQLRENQLDRETALQLCRQNGSPIADVFSAAVKKWGRPSVEVEQSVLDAGERVTSSLRRYLRLFNGISTISPMLGLLGTVCGMISSFNAISTSNAMGRPELLAEGIGEALLSTAAGLCVAIPALVAYWYFVGRVDRLIIQIDAHGQEVVDLIASDSWLKEQSEDGGRGKRRLKVA
ncbi:MAG: MotA/TolQ/ExbB proton channel family protein [Pirellulaceae bacterium]